MLALAPNPSLLELLMVFTKLRAWEQWHIEATTGTLYNAEEAAVITFQQAGPKWVILDGRDPVAVIGFVPHRKGVYEAWMASTDTAWKRPIDMTRIVRILFRSMFALDAKRIQHVVLDGLPAITAWYRSIWLNFEGKMRAWGAKGETALIYACTEIPQ